MAEFKLVISDPKTGKSVQREAKEDAAQRFIGMKLGDTVKGELIDLTGFEFALTGGSDYCGFPMRRDVLGTGRKKILAVHGIGIRKQGKGVKQRKTVCGNTVHERISQLNFKVLTHGREDLFAGAKGNEEKKKAAEKKEEAKPQQKEAAKEEIKAQPQREKTAVVAEAA